MTPPGGGEQGEPTEPAMPFVRPFVDHPVTDVAAATRAARRAAAHWGLEEPALLRAGMNVTFTSGAVVLRVSEPTTDASAALDLARMLADEGLRVPEPVRDDVVPSGSLRVTAWRRIGGTTVAIDWSAVGSMVRTVHSIAPTALPRSVPVPRPEHFPWWDFAVLLDRSASVIDAPARRGLEAAIERHRAWRDVEERVVCHGDVHPGNVMMTGDGPVLIDWDLLCWAPAGWDHGPMMTWASRWGGGAGDYDAFAQGYGRSMRDDPTAIAVAELRLVAATLMRLAAGLRDPDAMPEAQRRLQYWRGEPGAVAWTAQ